MKAANIVFAVGIAVLVVYVFDLMIDYFFYERSVELFAESVRPFQLVWLCGFTPIFEEAIFRELPYKLFKPDKEKELLFIIFVAIIFGWLHGSYMHIFAQGVAGIAFGWVYLRNGYSYLSAVAAHGLYNLMVAYLMPMLLQLSLFQ